MFLQHKVLKMNNEPAVITEAHLTETVEAFAFIIALLVDKLDRSKITSKKEFGASLKMAPEFFKAMPGSPSYPGGDNCIAFQIFRKVGEMVDIDDDPAPKNTSWKPIVIEGGKTET
jgi:hypothetical protein